MKLIVCLSIFKKPQTYSLAPPVDSHRPSVAVTLKSVAKFYGRATSILLTSMGRDSTEETRTVTQNEKNYVVFGMPKEAIALSAAHHVLPIQEIVRC